MWVPGGVKGLRITGWENKINNMPEEYTSNYAKVTVYILDDPGVVGAQSTATQLRHAQSCNNMRLAWVNTVERCTVHSITMQNGQRSKHLLAKIEQELQDKNEDDLVVFCFHGSAGGDGTGYTL